MKRQAYQHPELRDANDNIIQEGTYGKASPLVNGDNTGVLDYINNNLEALHDAQTAIASTYLPLSGGTMTGKLQNDGGAVPIELLTTGTDYKNIQTFSTDGNHRIGVIRMGKDSSNNCKVIIGASNTSDDTPNGIIITRGTSGNSVITGITPPAGDNSTKIATTEFVNAKAGNYLPLSGGTMTGNTLITMGNGESYVRNWGNGLYLGGTNDDNASRLVLFTNSSANGFQLAAGDGTTQRRMVGKPDGTLTWDGQPLLPVGVVQAFAGSTIPTGWLLCDGSAVSRTNYAALYAVIGTTYGAGNGSTTFNLPNLTDKFIQGSGTVGTVKAAGLPNITGSIGGGTGAGGPAGNGSGVGFLRDTMIDGCFQPAAGKYGGETGSGGGTLPSGHSVLTANLDASRSSAIYGKSTTVQPPALTMRYIIKY